MEAVPPFSAHRCHLVFQPIVALADTSVVAHEALLRVDGSSPVKLIAAVEAAGETLDLDRSVADLALRDAGSLPGRLHLNVSAATAQRHAGAFVTHLGAAAARAGVHPDRLVVEVTETAPILDLAAIADFADALHGLGCGLCADDVGSGSLRAAHLGAVDWDLAKIGADLVCRSGRPARRSEARILGAARERDIAVVVEGVADLAETQRLAALGARLGQAFIFGRPARLRSA